MVTTENLLNRAKKLEDNNYNDLWTLVVRSATVLKEIDPKHRKPWLWHVIIDIYDEQGGKCAICGKSIKLGEHEVDHKIPFVYGGGNERGNLQLVHRKCNNAKRAQVSPRDLLCYLEDRCMNLPCFRNRGK